MAKCNIGKVKLKAMLASGLMQRPGLLWGFAGDQCFYRSSDEVNHMLALPFISWDIGPVPPIPLGKYGSAWWLLFIEVLFTVTVPSGWRSQGCHGYYSRLGQLPQGFPHFPHAYLLVMSLMARGTYGSRSSRVFNPQPFFSVFRTSTFTLHPWKKVTQSVITINVQWR